MQAPEYHSSSLLMAENGAELAGSQDSSGSATAGGAVLPSTQTDTTGSGVTETPGPDLPVDRTTLPDAPAADAANSAADAAGTAVDAAAASPGTDGSALPSFDIDIFSTDFLLPALFALVTLALWFFGLRQSRLQTRRSVLLFLALNSLTLTVCVAADYNLAGRVPDWMLNISPLLWAVLYLLVGGVGKRPLVWGSALITPGLWFFAQRLDGMYFNLSRHTLPLPQDPAWFLLVGVVLFALMHVARIQKFWDDMEQPELTASFCYGMAGFWLLSLGEASALAMFGLPVYAWMVLLLGLAAVGLWVARLLSDLVLAVCCGLGIIGVLYSYGMYVFAPAAQG